MLQQQIENLCLSLNLDTYGFIPARIFNELEDFYTQRTPNPFEIDNINQRINPFLTMPNVKTILSIAFPYNFGLTSNEFSIYAQTYDYHKIVKSYLTEICSLLNKNGVEAISFVDNNPLPERYIAYLSGIGFIGRNQMLITKKYGSFVFLGEILMDAFINCEEKGNLKSLLEYKKCGNCNNCIKNCPPQAIFYGGYDSLKCLSYLTQKKDLTTEEIKLLDNNIFGCDICQNVCPYQKNVSYSPLQNFTHQLNDTAEQYASMSNAYFKQNLAHTSCGWRGKNVIKRNALIAMAHQGKDISTIDDNSPYIQDYKSKLLKL